MGVIEMKINLGVSQNPKKQISPAIYTEFNSGCHLSGSNPQNLSWFLFRILAFIFFGFACAAYAQANGFASQNGGTTGGAGGSVVKAGTGTQIHEALCGRSSNDEPIIIQVEGTINHGNTSKVSGSCNTAEDVIEIKDVSNITIVGVGQGAVFNELGIHIRNSSNIILQNLTVRNVKKSGSPISNGGDAIGMESTVSNVWVDHCTLEASGGEDEGYDAMIDMKSDTKYVTVSYCILRNSGRGGLIGSSDSDDNNGPVTFHHNLYRNIESRTPLLRHGTVHSYNNHFDGLSKSGMNPRIGGKIKAENNYFENAQNPLGTFYTTDMGFWDISGNIWGDNVTWKEADDEFPAGPNPESTTSIDIPYQYSPDDANCVPGVVEETAGADKNLAVSDGSCKSTPIGAVKAETARIFLRFPSFDLLGRSWHRSNLGPLVTVNPGNSAARIGNRH